MHAVIGLTFCDKRTSSDWELPALYVYARNTLSSADYHTFFSPDMGFVGVVLQVVGLKHTLALQLGFS